MAFNSLIYGSCSWRWSWTHFWRGRATASSLTNTSNAAGPASAALSIAASSNPSVCQCHGAASSSARAQSKDLDPVSDILVAEAENRSKTRAYQTDLAIQRRLHYRCQAAESWRGPLVHSMTSIEHFRRKRIAVNPLHTLVLGVPQQHRTKWPLCWADSCSAKVFRRASTCEGFQESIHLWHYMYKTYNAYNSIGNQKYFQIFSDLWLRHHQVSNQSQSTI